MQRAATSGNDANDDIHELYRRARAAFEEYKNWPQHKVDLVCQAVGYELSKPETAEALARLAVDESGIGVFEDKFHKVQNKTRGTMRDQRGARTCDLVEDDREKGIRKFAKPLGVVANVVPCTNPESTVCCIGLALLKTRNAMIVSPHPRTPGSSNLSVEHIRKALGKVGAPEDLALGIREPSHDKTRELMECCDFAVATRRCGARQGRLRGGDPLPHRGRRERGVDHRRDGGLEGHGREDRQVQVCQQLRVLFIGERGGGGGERLRSDDRGARGGRGLSLLDGGTREAARLLLARRQTPEPAIWWPGPPPWIAEKAGLEVPEDTRFLMVVGDEIGPADRFSGEKISPTLTLWKWSDFSEMCARLNRILAFSGAGHSASLHSERDERRVELALEANVGRLNCNMPHAAANSGSWFNGQPTTDSLGCGSWAGNMTSDNIDWRHFLNYTWLSVPIPEHIPADEELFGDYLAAYGRD